jgi:hypothetical protein
MQGAKGHFQVDHTPTHEMYKHTRKTVSFLLTKTVKQLIKPESSDYKAQSID